MERRLTDWRPTDVAYLCESDVNAILTHLRLRYPNTPFSVRGKEGEHLLQSALSQARQTFDGQDLYGTLYSKAAALLYCLVKNHPFDDGNKRFAVLAVGHFLDINNHFLDVDTDELTAWAVWIASEPSPDLAMLTEWISSKMKRLQD